MIFRNNKKFEKKCSKNKIHKDENFDVLHNFNWKFDRFSLKKQNKSFITPDENDDLKVHILIINKYKSKIIILNKLIKFLNKHSYKINWLKL